MTKARLQEPHDAFLQAAEQRSLVALRDYEQGISSSAFSDVQDWLDSAPETWPIRRICDGFALQGPPSALLVLLFAASLSEEVARLITRMTNQNAGVPLWLAQRLISGLYSDHCSHSRPLLRFGLIDGEPGRCRVETALALRPCVVDRLCGAGGLEPEVEARVAQVDPSASAPPRELTEGLGAALRSRGAMGLPPVVMAAGVEVETMAAALASLGMIPHRLNEHDLPEDPVERDRLARYWSRDAALSAYALIVIASCDSNPALPDFVDRIVGHVVVMGAQSQQGFRRSVRFVDDAAVTRQPYAPWLQALGPERTRKLDSELRKIATHFRLVPAEIATACARAGADIDAAEDRTAAARALWRAAGRAVQTTALPGVSVIEPTYAWDDIVVAPPLERTLRRVEAHVRHATTVLDDWGFAERMGGRGRGVTALFAGPSGTGKTMAAEVLASALDLRMLVIDLSQIISKYIGETAKHTAAAFDLAERTGAVMVWNEGDAIWGARGSVSHATDRHVNAEVGDLLQRIENFRGFTIVTTNLRNAIDPAFLRRFRFVVDFPMPSEAERLRLWQKAFPQNAPVGVVNWRALAPLPLSGSAIRNIALGSAFLAAESQREIGADLIALELGEELRKQNLPVPTIDWSARA